MSARSKTCPPRRSIRARFPYGGCSSRARCATRTLGGHLELVSEFEVVGGGEVHPHHHPTFEFYYVISGRGIMVIEGETREIRQGDLVKIPPNAVHSLKPVSHNASIRCLAFAVAVKDAPPIDYSSE